MPETNDQAPQAELRTAPLPVMPARKAQWRMKNPPATGWKSWWPLYAGIALSCLAPLLRSLLEPLAPWGMRAVFPFVLFFGLHELGMSDGMTQALPRLMLFLQFPIEGLLMRGSLSRGYKVSKAISQLFSLHFVAALVLWIVALGEVSAIK
jgi:hypothetical protein